RGPGVAPGDDVEPVDRPVERRPDVGVAELLPGEVRPAVPAEQLVPGRPVGLGGAAGVGLGCGRRRHTPIPTPCVPSTAYRVRVKTQDRPGPTLDEVGLTRAQLDRLRRWLPGAVLLAEHSWGL